MSNPSQYKYNNIKMYFNLTYKMLVLYYNHDCIPSSFCKLGNLKAYFKIYKYYSGITSVCTSLSTKW